jgi:poly(3-hydroxybutyrate) depolymerase
MQRNARKHGTLLLILLICTVCSAQQPGTIAIANDAIPVAQLEKMDRRELGDTWRADIAPKLRNAHELLEKYFSSKTTPERAAAVKELVATNIDANILGRICRIRLYWPQIDGGVYYINEKVGPHQIMYFVGVPKGYDRSIPWPLVIKLPAEHMFTTNPRPGPEEVTRIYTDWIRDELAKHPDAIVLMPVLNLDELWGPSYAGVNTVIQPMHHIAGRLNIDPARVYMLGHAMSAHATWNLALHYPTYFAAINPMAGGTGGAWQKVRIPALRNIFCVIWHDQDDTQIKVDASREMARILRNLKYDVEYKETKGVGHAPTDPIAEELYQKMRARTRELYPREVVHGSNRPDSLYNRNDWVQVYQMLNPGGDQKFRIQYGSGTMTQSANSYKITAAMTALNKIEVKSENVEVMRFYLNEQNAEFSKPITVIVNGKVRFEGKVQPSVEEMLKDQLFLGRGWRYFTAFIDVDFSNLGGAKPATQPTTRPKGKIEVILDK